MFNIHAVFQIYAILIVLSVLYLMMMFQIIVKCVGKMQSWEGNAQEIICKKEIFACCKYA
jgi:hypothetical protein